MTYEQARDALINSVVWDDRAKAVRSMVGHIGNRSANKQRGLMAWISERTWSATDTLDSVVSEWLA